MQPVLLLSVQLLTECAVALGIQRTSLLVFSLKLLLANLQVSHEIARSNLDTFLTPSSIAAELRPDLDPHEAANVYTGEDTLLFWAEMTRSH